MKCPECKSVMHIEDGIASCRVHRCMAFGKGIVVPQIGPLFEYDPTTDNCRYFPTGATRDTAEGKLDIHRFLSPEVLERYCQYLQAHRQQSDGKLRDPDNWKKGMPLSVYMASMTRHFFEVWSQYHTGERGEVDDDALCALMFNVMGFLYENMGVRRGEGDV